MKTSWVKGSRKLTMGLKSCSFSDGQKNELLGSQIILEGKKGERQSSWSWFSNRGAKLQNVCSIAKALQAFETRISSSLRQELDYILQFGTKLFGSV